MQRWCPSPLSTDRLVHRPLSDRNGRRKLAAVSPSFLEFFKVFNVLKKDMCLFFLCFNQQSQFFLSLYFSQYAGSGVGVAFVIRCMLTMYISLFARLTYFFFLKSGPSERALVPRNARCSGARLPTQGALPICFFFFF